MGLSKHTVPDSIGEEIIFPAITWPQIGWQVPDYGKRFQGLEVFPVGEKGGCGEGGTDLQILGFQMGVEEVEKTL